MSFLHGNYNFERDTYSLLGARGTSDEKLRLGLNNTFGANQLTFDSYVKEEGTDGEPTRETFLSTKLNERENVPHEFSFDHIVTNGTESEDGLVGTNVRTQVGATLKTEDSVTLRGSRTTDTEYLMDVGEGQTETIGGVKTHFAGQLTLGIAENEGTGSFQGVAMREQTGIDGMRGIAGDISSAWSDTGRATEVGVTVARGFNGNNTTCRVGVRHETGSGYVYAQNPKFSSTSGRGVRTTRSCGVTFVDGDEGQSAEANFQITQTNGRGNSLYVRGTGEFSGVETTTSLGAGLELATRPYIKPMTAAEREEARQGWMEFMEELKGVDNPRDLFRTPSQESE
jgi:hypothetical protein